MDLSSLLPFYFNDSTDLDPTVRTGRELTRAAVTVQHVVTRREDGTARQDIARQTRVAAFSLLYTSFKLLHLLFELHRLLLFALEIVLQLLIRCLQLEHAPILLDLRTRHG